MANQPRRGDEWKYHRWKDFGRQEAAQTPRSDSNRHSRDSLSAKISPPDLKRHRTVTEFSSNSRERPSSTLSRNESYPNSDRNHLGLFGGNKRPVNEQVRHEPSFESLRHSSSFLGTSAYERRDSSASAIETDGTHSGSSSRRGSLSKRTCRVCEKSSATNYNPMIMCPGCDRPYHDSCRRPPLHEGDDPQSWRCLKCFNGPRKRKRANFDTLRTSKGSLESSSGRDLTPGGSMSRPVERTSSPVKLVREPSNTPSKSVLSRSLYPDPPKLGPAIETNVYEPAHRIKSNLKDYAPVGYQPASVKGVTEIATSHEPEQGAALTVACANCRQYCGFTEDSSSIIKCHDCQKQTISTEGGERVVPETPDMRQAQSPITPQIPTITSKTRSPLPVKAAQSGKKAIKSAPKSKFLGFSRPPLTPKAPTPVSKSPIIVKKDDNVNFMPFERKTSREPRNLPDLSKIKHVRNFHEVKEHDHQPAVETMTEAEKASKIDKIKGRRSRKKFFGRDHRLAHVRRHYRQDIHNECDGAWKPACHPSPRNSFNNEMRDKDEPKSAREVFGLPGDAVPVNDGQTELAFRDGTLTNGRLPRSRLIYKVGKLVGGELTVRTSS